MSRFAQVVSYFLRLVKSRVSSCATKSAPNSAPAVSPAEGAALPLCLLRLSQEACFSPRGEEGVDGYLSEYLENQEQRFAYNRVL